MCIEVHFHYVKKIYWLFGSLLKECLIAFLLQQNILSTGLQQFSFNTGIGGLMDW